MAETLAQKKARILGTERTHGEPPAALAAAIPVDHAPGEPIDAPLHTELAYHTKWYAPRGGPISSFVVHCTAATNPASSTAAFFASPSDSGSTQGVVDDDTGFQCVPDDAVCAGAPPLNQEGKHVEMPGLVTWSRETWLSHPDQLRRMAYLAAKCCFDNGLPVVLLHAADLVRLGEKAKGITYHWAISLAFKQSTHDDPGPNFPWDVFMGLVQQFYDLLTGHDQEDDAMFQDFEQGSKDFRAAKAGTKVDPTKSDAYKFGWYMEGRITAATVKPANKSDAHEHDVPAGRTGPPVR